MAESIYTVKGYLPLLKLEGEQAQLGAIHDATMHALRGGAVSDFMESFPDVLLAGDVSARLQQLEEEKVDILEAYLDTKRLAREIDVALHGEAGAAQQASLCDLVGPAQKLRAALAETRAALHAIVCVNCLDNHVYAQSVSCYCDCHSGESAREAEIRDKLTKALASVQAQEP